MRKKQIFSQLKPLPISNKPARAKITKIAEKEQCDALAYFLLELYKKQRKKLT